jgi:hypothetical protein
MSGLGLSANVGKCISDILGIRVFSFVSVWSRVFGPFEPTRDSRNGGFVINSHLECPESKDIGSLRIPIYIITPVTLV